MSHWGSYLLQPNGWSAHEDSEHLAGNEPFEATQDLRFREPLLRSVGGISLGLLIPSQPHHGDAVQSRIGLAVPSVPSPVQAMAVGLA